MFAMLYPLHCSVDTCGTYKYTQHSTRRWGRVPGATAPMNIYALLLHILQLLPSAAHLICPDVHPEEEPPEGVVVVVATAGGEGVFGLGEVVSPGETVLTVVGEVFGVATY